MKFIPTKDQLKAWTKYIALGVVVFSIGLVWNFPLETIKSTLIGTITKNSGGYKVDMDQLSFALPLGLVAKNARIQSPPNSPDPLDLEFSVLRTTVSPWAPLVYLFTKSVSFSFSAFQDKTKWTGSVSLGKEDADFEINTKGWKIYDFKIPLGMDADPMLTGTSLSSTVSFSSELSGKIASLQKQDLSPPAEGDLDLTITNVELNMPAVTKIRFDKIQAVANLEKGKLEIKSITFNGPDLVGSANGFININPFLMRSIIEMDTKLTLVSKNALLKVFLTNCTPGALCLKLTEDGKGAFKITGPLNHVETKGY